MNILFVRLVWAPNGLRGGSVPDSFGDIAAVQIVLFYLLMLNV